MKVLCFPARHGTVGTWEPVAPLCPLLMPPGLLLVTHRCHPGLGTQRAWTEPRDLCATLPFATEMQLRDVYNMSGWGCSRSHCPCSRRQGLLPSPSLLQSPKNFKPGENSQASGAQGSMWFPFKGLENSLGKGRGSSQVHGSLNTYK